MTKKDQNFEKSLVQLEEIVEKLENGDVDLDESLKIFEEGVDLFKFCQKKLDQANVKINILSKNLTTSDDNQKK